MLSEVQGVWSLATSYQLMDFSMPGYLSASATCLDNACSSVAVKVRLFFYLFLL